MKSARDHRRTIAMYRNGLKEEVFRRGTGNEFVGGGKMGVVLHKHLLNSLTMTITMTMMITMTMKQMIAMMKLVCGNWSHNDNFRPGSVLFATWRSVRYLVLTNRSLFSLCSDVMAGICVYNRKSSTLLQSWTRQYPVHLQANKRRFH